MKKRYLIILSGQGDTIIKVVNQETWEYIFSPAPKFVLYGAKETLPAGVAADDDFDDDDDDEPTPTPNPNPTISVTSGSYENDRALLVKGEQSFYSLSDYTKWVKKSKAKIADEYHGLIY